MYEHFKQSSVFAHIQVKDFLSLNFCLCFFVCFLELKVSGSCKSLLLLQVLVFASPGMGRWKGTAYSNNPVELHVTASDRAETGSCGSIKLYSPRKYLTRKYVNTVFGCSLLKSLLAFISTLVVVVKDKQCFYKGYLPSGDFILRRSAVRAYFKNGKFVFISKKKGLPSSSLFKDCERERFGTGYLTGIQLFPWKNSCTPVR